MNPALPAQALAQLASLAIFIAAARWYVVPWLSNRRRAEALTALLWVHVFRYVALQIFSAQQQGFPMSPSSARAVVIGDVGGALIAFIAILLLRARARAAIPLIWLLVAETALDTVTNIRDGVREHLMGAATGITWMTLVFFVPLVVVSAGLLAQQLFARRGQQLDEPPVPSKRSSAAAPRQSPGNPMDRSPEPVGHALPMFESAQQRARRSR